MVFNVNAGVLGDFSNTSNSPGFINLNKKSSLYKGIYKKPDFGDGVIKMTPSQLISTYFIQDKVNLQKITNLIEEVESYIENARIGFCQKVNYIKKKSQKKCRSGFVNNKNLNKWKKNKVYIALMFSIKKLKEAIISSNSVNKTNINKKISRKFVDSLFLGLEIYQGVVKENAEVGRWSGLPGIVLQSKNVFRKIQIKKGRIEAANLVRADENVDEVFYSPSQLKLLKQSGVDISLLNPQDSGFWRKPTKSISDFDTSNYDKSDITNLKMVLNDHNISALLNSKKPISVIYKVKRPKETGKSPKFDVKFENVKLKFTTDRFSHPKSLNPIEKAMQIAVGNEVNQEQVVNNLAAAIGFTVDPTYYKDIVRVFFEDEIYLNNKFDTTYKQFLKILEDKYGESFNIEDSIKTIKVDVSTGRKYIEMKHVQLERKSDLETDINIGRFIRIGLGKAFKREHRAFSIFAAWIWDTDTKDDNDKLKLIPTIVDGKKTYKLAFSNSDMGASLGFNNPNLYNYKLVKKIRKDKKGDLESIEFNYYRMYAFKIMDSVSIDDAKWIARMIGQISFKQMTDAFEGAGYPKLVGLYYSKLMMKKRNELLDALGLLGDVFLDFGGNQIELKKEDEFNGTIVGYEEFFKKGQLTDPDNKLYNPQRDAFPRNWGVGLNNNNDEPQKELIKLIKMSLLTLTKDLVHSLVFENMKISNKGFEFKPMTLSDKELEGACLQNCFFQGSSQMGLSGFLPWRFIVSNPNPDSEYPYWIVDMFRFGFFLGHDLESAFGMSLPTSFLVGASGEMYYIREFIKIKPIKTFKEYLGNKKDLFKLPRLTFKNARKEFTENMTPGEVLLVSSYIGAKAQVKIRPLDAYIPLFSPAIIFGGGVLNTNRITVLALENKEVLTSWDKLNAINEHAQINIFDTLFEIPVFEADRNRLKKMQKTFKFNLQDENQKELFFDNLGTTVPKNIPLSYAVKSREINMKERMFRWGLIGIMRKAIFRKNIKIEYKDHQSQFSVTDYSYVKKYEKEKQKERLGVELSEYTVKASVSSRKEIYAKVNFDFHYENVDKRIFKKILNKISAILPDEFIQFDPESVLQNFGILEVKSEVIFSKNALRQIFDTQDSRDTFCMKYSRSQKLNWNLKTCQNLNTLSASKMRTMSRSIGVQKRLYVLLRKRFEKAQSAFWTLELFGTSYNKNQTRKTLKLIVKALGDSKSMKYHSLNFYISLISKDNFFRKVEMISELAAFPGNISRINEDIDDSGLLIPNDRLLGDLGENPFSLFTDEIHKAIGDLFMNNEYEPMTRI